MNVNVKAGDDVKGKISLWNDFNDWGRFEQTQGNNFGSTTSTSTAQGTNAAAGTNNGQFGFREAWINFNLPGIPVNVTAGHQLLQLGDGWFFRSMHFGSDAWVVANVTGANTVAVVDVKVSEGDVAVSHDDIDAYVLLDVYKLNDSNTIGAYLADVHHLHSAVSAGDDDLYNLGLNYGGKLGSVNLNAQGDYQFGEDKASTPGVSKKYQGYEIAIKGNVPLDPVTINFLIGMGSGKKSTDTSTDYKAYVNFLDIDPHYTFLYEYKIATAAGAKNTGLSNTEVVSVGAAYAASKSVNLGLDLYYLQATQKIVNGVGAESSDVGTEIDAKIYWKLYDNLSWNWDLGYFAPGAALKTATGKTDAAYGVQGILALNF